MNPMRNCFISILISYLSVKSFDGYLCEEALPDETDH